MKELLHTTKHLSIPIDYIDAIKSDWYGNIFGVEFIAVHQYPSNFDSPIDNEIGSIVRLKKDGSIRAILCKVIQANIRRCILCGTLKPLHDFHIRKDSNTFRTECKDCHNQRTKRWTIRNTQQFKETKSNYYKNNKTMIDEKNKLWSENNKERRRFLSRKTAAKRAFTKKNALPSWADLEAIADVYKEAQYHGLEVDHIIPLQSKIVQGFHVLDNLQLLTIYENRSKGNKAWPEMPS